MISSPHSAVISKKMFKDEKFSQLCNVADKTGCDVTDVMEKRKKDNKILTFCLETVLF